MAKKVLIIDDDFDLVEAMRITLEAAGYDVVDAQDGERGLEKIKSESPDLIILDVMMAFMLHTKFGKMLTLRIPPLSC